MKILIVMVIMGLSLFASQPYSAERQYTQSDGSVLSLKIKGDQYGNWFETKNGVMLKYNQSSGNFEYLIIKDGELKPNGIMYKNIQKSSSRVNNEPVNSELKNKVFDLQKNKREKYQVNFKNR